MMLRTLPPDHLEMVRHWIDFTVAHRDTLLKGTFRPYHPESAFPVIVGESAAERIVAVYEDTAFAPCGAADRKTIVVNATAADSLVVELAAAPVRVRAFDCRGREVVSPKLTAGVQRVAIPVSGHVEIEY